MKFFIITVLVSMLVFMSSCKEEGLPGEIQDLKKKAEIALEEAKKLDIDYIKDKKKEAEGFLETLGPYFNQFQKDALKTFVDLSNAAKAQKKSHFDDVNLVVELQKSVDQLESLYNETKIDSLSEEQIKLYLKKESEILEKLQEKTDFFKSQMDYLEDKYSKLLPKAKAIADSLM